MASRNEATREIYPGFSGCAIWSLPFSKKVLSAWWESTAASSSTIRRSSRPEVFCRPTFFHRTPLVVVSEYEIQTSTLTEGREQEEQFSDSTDNENTNEEEENNTKQTNNKSLEDELDIELFVDLFTWNNITSLQTINKQVSLCFSIVEAMLLNCLDVFYSLS